MSRTVIFFSLLCLCLQGVYAARPGDRVVDWDVLRDLRNTDLNRLQRGPRWLDDYDQAVHVADARNSTLVVLFVRERDPFSVKLKQDTLADPKLWPHLRAYTLVEVDVDRDPGLAFRHQLREVPAMLWLDPEGRELHRVVGVAATDDLIAYIDRIRTPGAMELPPVEAGLIARLKKDSADLDAMRGVLRHLHTGGQPQRLRAELRSLNPVPTPAWISLLTDEALHIRLAALELLEEQAGNTFGYDPWESSTTQQDALAKWNKWADRPAAKDEQERYAPLTKTRMLAAIRDLDQDSPEHVTRAVRTLERAGPSLIPHLLVQLESGDLSASQQERLEDILLGLRIAGLGWDDATGVSFRLRRGPLDARMELLREVAREGSRGVPVLAAFLEDPDVLIRETVIEGLLQAGGRNALPLVLERLETEPSSDIALAAMRQVAGMRDSTATDWLNTQLESDQEDRILAALTAMQKGQHDSLAPVAVTLLEDPRWRVRATAATTLGAIRYTQGLKDLAKRHADPDAFARTAALDAALKMMRDQSKRSAVVKEWYDRNPNDLEVLVRVICDHRLDLPSNIRSRIDNFDKENQLSLLRVLVDCGDTSLPIAMKMSEDVDGDVRAAALRVLALHGVSKQPLTLPNDANRRLARALQVEPLETRQMILLYLDLPAPRSDSYGGPSFIPFVPYVPEGTAGEDDDSLDELLGAFTEEKPVRASPSGDPLNELMGAFEDPEPPSATGSSELSLHAELIRLFESGEDPTLQKLAAKNLASVGHEPAVAALQMNDPDLSSDELETLLSRNQDGQEGLSLARKMLKDRRSDIKRVAAAHLGQFSLASDFLPLLDEVDRDSSSIRLKDLPVTDWRIRSSIQSTPADKLNPFITKWLEEKGDPTPARQVRRALALSMAVQYPDAERKKQMDPFLNQETDPELRALAWLHNIMADRAITAEQARELSEDPATIVRTVLPFLYLTNRSKDWPVSPSHLPGVEISSHSVQSQWTLFLDETGEEVLTELLEDPMPEVRFLTGLALIVSGKELTSPESWDSSIRAARQNPWLKSMSANTLRLLAQGSVDLPPEAQKWAQEQQGSRSYGGFVGDPFGGLGGIGKPTAVTESSTGASEETAALAEGEAEMAADVPPVVIYIYSTNCEDCDIVSAFLAQYQQELPGLEIRALDIADPDTLDVATSLYRRAGIPLTEVGLTPMLAGAGGLSAGSVDLTYERVGELITSSMNGTGSQWIPEPDVLPEVEDRELIEALRSEEPLEDVSEPVSVSAPTGTVLQGWILLLLPICALAYAPVPIRKHTAFLMGAGLFLGAMLPTLIPIPIATALLMTSSFWNIVFPDGTRSTRSLSSPIAATSLKESSWKPAVSGALLMVILGNAVPFPSWVSSLSLIPGWGWLLPIGGSVVMFLLRHRSQHRLRWVTAGGAGVWLLFQLLMQSAI